MVPHDVAGVVITLGLVVPGFVYQGMLRRFRGPNPEDRDVSVRILRAFTTSALLALVYLAVLGGRILEIQDPDGELRRQPRLLAWYALVLVFVIPAALVVIQRWIGAKVSGSTGDWLRKRKLTTYDPTPTAWDFSFTGRGPRWIRVLLADGSWVGGYFGEQSYASSWPEAQQLFIQEQYEMTEDGGFGAAVGASAGVYVRCDDVRVVEFLAVAIADNEQVAQCDQEEVVG